MSEAETLSRKPVPDHAEENAFFPSAYSLSQYTAAKTDFDGTIEGTYSGGRWKVLVIATDERYMLMDNGTMFSTGNHPVETLLPLHHMIKAGFGVDVATVSGNPAKIEWWAFPGQDDAMIETRDALLPQLKQPLALADVVRDKLGPDSDYLGVFIPGGHGALLGIPTSHAVQEVLDWALANDRVIVSLCHGPAGFLAAGLDRETSPFAGYRMCVFPDALDVGPNVEIGYLPGQMPWLLGEALRKAGVEIVNEGISGQTVRDRNVLTGDSPLASNALGKMATEALLEAASSQATNE